MIDCQRHNFKIPDSVSYLNCAYMSPFFKKIEKIGHRAVSKKCLPFEIKGDDFFENTSKLKVLFSKLVSIPDYNNVAIIPATSYGVATVTNNIILNKGEEIIVVDEQFPSNIYSWINLIKKHEGKLINIAKPKTLKNRAKLWNKEILKAINPKTKVVAMPIVHWSDGTLFNIEAIRKKTRENNALLIIDGTQSIGALPFSVSEIQPDALICSGYKWLLGPYSIGLAYFSDELCKGNPIEENWINRKNSQNFANLVNYESDYQPKAGKFNVGEMSNFTLTPMLLESIKQLLDWKPERIQEYTKYISEKAIRKLKRLGCFIENENYRAAHLFGIYLPENTDLNALKKELSKQKVYVSFRGNAVRVSPHLYNTKMDFEKLVMCFTTVLKK